MDNNSISIDELVRMKEELRRFSHMPTSRVYAIMSKIYKSNITPKQLIKSEITRSFARISRKNIDDYNDDPKKQKSVKIAKKLIKNWKTMLGYDDINKTPHLEIPPQKKVKLEHKNGTNVPAKATAPAPAPIISDKPKPVPVGNPPSQVTRDKAILGLHKYLSKYNSEASMDFTKSLEEEILQRNATNEDNYKAQVKSLVKAVDQNVEFRNKLWGTDVNVETLIDQL